MTRYAVFGAYPFVGMWQIERRRTLQGKGGLPILFYEELEIIPAIVRDGKYTGGTRAGYSATFAQIRGLK